MSNGEAQAGSGGPEHGPALVLDLARERERAVDPETLERSGRSARTLLKLGPLRVTLVVVAAGGVIAEHRAPGPITVQILSGGLRFSAEGRDHELGPGDLLALEAGVPHAVASAEGAAFLLTVALP